MNVCEHCNKLVNGDSYVITDTGSIEIICESCYEKEELK